MIQIIFVILLATVGVAYSGESTPITAKQILQKMVRAMELSDYQGTVIFLKNDKLEAMKYFHTSSNNKEEERLVSLNSPMREIIRNSDEVTCLFKLTQQVIVDHRPYEHSFIVDVPKNLDELDASYEFEVVGEEDVAMIPTYVVAIQPKDEFRYIRKIWVSKGQFLPMKAEVYNISGVVLEQVAFTEIQVKKQATATAPSQQPIGVSLSAQGSDEAKNQTPSQAGFEVTAMPRGFKQIFFARKPLHKSEQPVDHLLLSDGFASVSVYMETKKVDMPSNSDLPEVIHSVGAVNSISRELANSQLTVLGEVPATTVKFIAAGIKLRSPAP